MHVSIRPLAGRRARRRRPTGRLGGRASRRGALTRGLAIVGLVAAGAAAAGAGGPLLGPREAARPAPGSTLTTSQQAFVHEVSQAARRLRGEVGLPPSLVVAMAINETGWGRSTLARRAHNYFGIKALVGAGPAGSVDEETEEVVDGRLIRVRAPFRAYHSLDEGVVDLGQFLRTNPRYAAVWAAADEPRAAARALAAAGYATDPSWADKLCRLIDDFALWQLDVA